MPAPGGRLPTLPQVLAWDVECLTRAADHWTQTATTWERVFTEVATTTLGTAEPPWHGATARAAQQRAGQDRMRVIGVADEVFDDYEFNS